MTDFVDGNVLHAAELNAMLADIAKVRGMFAVVTDSGAVGDFVVGPGGTGTGTDNSAAFALAYATGRPLWIPDGDFYISTLAARQGFEQSSAMGPGRVWGDTNRGKAILGKTLYVGATNTHEILHAGGVKWAPDGSSNGSRIYEGHHNWMIVEPDNGPMQFQLYPAFGGKGYFGTTAHFVAPNKIVADLAPFDTSIVRAGNHVGFAGVVFKVASVIDGSNITVTNFDGSAVSFTTDTTPRPFYVSYECSMFVGNVSGTTVTRTTGDALPFGYSGDHMYALINGTQYAVSAGPETTGNPNTLTLSASAGTIIGATVEFYRTYGPWAYVTLFRLQGLGGGVETNGGLAFTIKNQLRIWNGGNSTDPLSGDVKLNGTRIVLGQGDGSTDDELVEVGGNYVTLGGRPGSSSRNFVQIDSLGALYAPVMKAAGAVANMPLVLDGKGNRGVQFGAAANYIEGLDAATTFAPSLAARGSDANVNMGFDLKGDGGYLFTAGTYGRIVLEVLAPTWSNAWPQLSALTSNQAFLGAASLSANADLILSAKGAGKLLPKLLPACVLKCTSAISFPQGSGTTITWDTEEYDPQGMHAAGSSVVTIPANGVYRISAAYEINGTGDWTNSNIITAIYVLKNGSAVAASGFTRHRVGGGAVTGVGHTYTRDMLLSAGDTIAIQGYYGGQAGTNATLDNSFSYTSLSVCMVTAT